MGSKSKGRKVPPLQQSSRLSEHQQVKKTLLPPLAQLPMTPVRWNPDMIPEMLLIDATAHQLTWDSAPRALHQAFDILDQFIPEDSKEVLLGTVSSFSLIPEDRRSDARSALVDTELFDVLLPEGLCHGLSLYPLCPISWLLHDWKQTTSVDWEVGTSYLKEAVVRLWESRSVYSTRCRMVPLARMMKNGKLHFTSDITSIKLFPRYPTGLNEDEQRLVESSTRAMFNALAYNFEGHLSEWVPHFWRHSYTISPCVKVDKLDGIAYVDDTALQKVVAQLDNMSARFRDAVETASQQAKLDIYDLDRDEVLFGILSRQYRLFNALATDPSLWSADLGRMFHRVMVDSLITFKWLVKQNDPTIFQKFKHFSAGKQKLLKLHIEELVEQGREDLAGLAAHLAENVNEEIWEEFLSIDLGGNFAGIDTRKMAHEVDLREMYNLVYSPASSELHGEWMSLKRFNLANCGNPLHRFHRLPQLLPSNVIAPGAVIFAASVLLDTFTAWLDAYALQHLKSNIDGFTGSLEAVFAEI